MLAPGVLTTRGILTASAGMGFGLPIRAGSRTHSEQRRPALASLDPLYELRGKLQLDLSHWLPFSIFTSFTYPLSKTGEIDLGHQTITGRSATLQFGLSSR